MNNDKDLFRLIANPYLLNKKEIKIIIKEDLLLKYLKEKYKIYIHNDFIEEIKKIIDEKIYDYIIETTTKEIVNECIQNVLEKFDNINII